MENIDNQNKEILVSIICLAYNHSLFIKKALDSFVSQKTSFNYEIVIHDDCSTDGTKEIIEEYEHKYPHLITALYEETNQYSKGVAITDTYLLPNARGKYIAICEGDDYWCDSNKLEKQITYMEEHKECSMCISNAIVVDPEENIIGEIKTVGENGLVQTEEIIKNGGGFIPTNSIVCYKRDYINKPDFFKIIGIDYILQMYLASKGTVYCFSDKMVAYRKGVAGSWTDRNSSNEKRKNIHSRIIKALEEYDEFCRYSYHNAVVQAITENRFNLDIYSGKNVFMNKEYRIFISKIPVFKRIKLLLRLIFPKFYTKIKSIRGPKNE